MRVPLKQIIVAIAFSGLAVLLYFAPRGYPGVKNKAEGQAQQQGDDHADFHAQVEEVKKELGPEKTQKVDLFEKQLSSAASPKDKVIALDSLINQWDKLMRPFIAAHYSFEKSDILNTFAAWFETGNRFFALTSFVPPDKPDDKATVFQQAAQAYQNALKLNPNDVVVRTRLAVCQVESNPDPMTTGIKVLLDLVKEDSTNIEAQLNLGMFSLKSTQYSKAEKRFRTVIALDPAYKDGYWYMAGAMEGQNKPTEAVKYYREYIKRNKENPSENEEIEKYIDKLINKKN
ncbi:MAG: tetratricopeptide repeat protein [Sphingobacteriales bacterium JAD_PAG50586_3]|nr:MAG: tetratricopeptide repeat protein [Sphingobacteriales bacterium JAD_PAG50586_3]